MPKLPTKTPAAPADEKLNEQSPLEEVRKAAPKKAAASPRLLAKARTLSDVPDQLNGLWTGDNGTGKTTAALTMANLGKTLLVNAEGGAKPRALRRRGINTDNIVVLPEDPAELSFAYLKDLAWEIKSDLAKDPTSWVGAVWDSITDIHMRLVRNVVQYQFTRATDRGESRISTASPGDMLNEHFIDLSDYGVMTSQMVELIKLWHDIPFHFAVTALLRRDKDDDGKVLYRPAVTPALRNELQGVMDVVCVTTVDEMPDGGADEYRGLFAPAGKYRGKDREGVLPKRLIDPTFERVWDYVTEKLTVDDDPVMQEAKARRKAGEARQVSEAVDARGDDEEPEEGQEDPTEAKGE
jgi:hypothetical protein